MTNNRHVTERLDVIDALESHLADHDVVRRRAARLLLLVGLLVITIFIGVLDMPFTRTILALLGVGGLVVYLRLAVNVWLLKRARDAAAIGPLDESGLGDRS